MSNKNNETTTKFNVDISELKKAMQDAKRQISVANSEFKAVASSMDNWGKSSDGLKAKLKQLDSNLKSQKTILSSLEAQYEAVVKEQGENSTAADRLKISINNQKAAISQTEREIGNYTESLTRAEKAEDIARKTGKDAADVFDELGDEAKDAGKSAEKSADGFTVMRGALAKLVADGIEKAISALKDFTKAALNVGMDFEASMSEVAAISGATGKELELLEKTAKEYGATTVFSASESAQALKYMALAGWDAEKSASALGGILDLAASSGMDLAQASDMVTDYMSAFGMEASQSTYFADLLAYAQSNANTSAEQLGEAYKNTAASMKAAGQDVETTTALLSMMANQGFKGSEAGTALTAIMRDMTAKMKDGKIAIGETSVEVMDANGNYRDLTEILKEVEAATNGMGDAERATALKTTFTADSTKGLNLLLNAGIGEAENFEKALRNAGGTAADMGATMNDNAQGDIKALESALEGVKIEVYKELQPYIRKFIQYLTKDGVKTIKEVSSSLVNLAKKSIPLVKKTLETLLKVVKFATNNFETLVGVIGTGIILFKALKAAMAIANTISAFSTAVAASTVAVNAAQKAQLLWNAAMSANVIGAVVTAVALLTAGIAALVISQSDAKKGTDLLTEAQRNTVNSAKDAANAYKETKKAADDLATAESANIKYTQNLWKELQTLTTENGKVKDGYESRAKFILEQLNEALGTEYTMNGNIITQYGEMKQSIDDLIETKKAQILIDAYSDTYAEAVKKVAEAEKARAIQAQELAAQQAIYDEAERQAIEARAALQEKVDAAKSESDYRKLASEAQYVDQLEASAEKEKGILDKKQTEYGKASASLQQYYDDIDAYEIASGLMLEGKTSEAIAYLDTLGSGFQTAASLAGKSAEEQKAILEQQVVDAQINLELLKDEYAQTYQDLTDEEKKQADARLKSARDQVDQAAEEFRKVGGNIVLGIVDGMGTEEWFFTQAMEDLIKAGVKAAQDAAKIHSPSRLFRDAVGKFLGLGIAEGIEDSTKNVIGSVKNQIGDIKDAYSVDTLKGIAGGTVSGLTTGVGGVGKPAASSVINNYNQVINSPKQLSRLEIYRQSKNLLGYAGGGV